MVCRERQHNQIRRIIMSWVTIWLQSLFYYDDDDSYCCCCCCFKLAKKERDRREKQPNHQLSEANGVRHFCIVFVRENQSKYRKKTRKFFAFTLVRLWKCIWNVHTVSMCRVDDTVRCHLYVNISLCVSKWTSVVYYMHEQRQNETIFYVVTILCFLFILPFPLRS